MEFQHAESGNNRGMDKVKEIASSVMKSVSVSLTHVEETTVCTQSCKTLVD